MPSFQPAPPDTGGPIFRVVPDTSADLSSAESERVLEEAAQRRRELANKSKPKPFSEPRYVMLRSALLPGWGQFYNGAWLKAIGVAAGEIGLAVGIYQDEKELDRLSNVADEALADSNFVEHDQAALEYNAILDQATRRKWFLGGLLAYALADAYVDAHFKSFNIEFDTPRSTSGGRRSFGGRLRLRWSF